MQIRVFLFVFSAQDFKICSCKIYIFVCFEINTHFVLSFLVHNNSQNFRLHMVTVATLRKCQIMLFNSQAMEHDGLLKS